MINRDKLKHILEYARQQQKFASPSCRIPPGDMVEIMERLLLAESVCTCPSGDGSLRWPCPAHAGNSPAQSDCCPAQNCIHSAQGVDRPVAWHHSAKSKEGNHGTCCFSYASSHDFGPRYEKPQSQPHYLPERLDYDRALHFLSTEPRKVTPETVIGGNSPVIPDGYVMVPKEPTEEMIAAAMNCEDVLFNSDDSFCVQFGNIYEAMLAAANCSIPMISDKWIPVSEQLPEDSGRYWCYVEEQNDLGKSHYQWNCSWNGDRWWVESEGGGIVTHWMPLPAAPQEVRHG